MKKLKAKIEHALGWDDPRWGEYSRNEFWYYVVIFLPLFFLVWILFFIALKLYL